MSKIKVHCIDDRRDEKRPYDAVEQAIIDEVNVVRGDRELGVSSVERIWPGSAAGEFYAEVTYYGGSRFLLRVGFDVDRGCLTSYDSMEEIVDREDGEMILDCIGRRIEAGDYVLYAKNHGGNPVMAYAQVVCYGERKDGDASSKVLKVLTPSPRPGDPHEESWRSERCLQWSKSGQLFVVKDPPAELLAKFRRTK